MKKILAVSGGVDSMTLFDIFVRKYPSEELVVATFDHGTRESSRLDADFVESSAKKKGIKVYRGEAKLGENISEEKAREERYRFLKRIAFLERGEIFTAHHLDDLIETVAINLLRGTGVRGLACFSGLGIRRPFFDGFFDTVFDKKDILRYAAENKIVFRQDPTNEKEDYLRNRVRSTLKNMTREEKMKIFSLWKEQKAIVREIEEIIEDTLPEDGVFERRLFREVGEEIGLEILRMALVRHGISTTIPQREEFFRAILGYEPGKKFNLPGDKLVKIRKDDFRL